MTKNADPWYNSETGKFWREAGCQGRSGYRVIWFRGRQHLEHRVAWYLHHGEWPNRQVDHINGVRGDNRIANLRLATQSENSCNRQAPRNNRSGFKGVSWNSGRRAWQATIRFEGINRNLGYFATRETAALVYSRAALRYHGEFAKLDL